MQLRIPQFYFSHFSLLKPCVAALIAAISVSVYAEDVALSWSDNSDNEDGFCIERAIGDGAFEELAQVGVDVETYTDTTAQAGVDYRYRVNAFNAFGYSGYTNVASHYINVVPSLTDIADVSVEENETTADIGFSVSDFETAGSDLSVTITSSNTALLDASTVTVASNGADRSFTLTPSPNVAGESVITVIVSDGEDSSSKNFLFAVNAFLYPTLQLSLDSIGSQPRAGEPFLVQANASDTTFVSSVSYWLAGELVETVTQAPYEASISISETGSFTLSAVADITGRDQDVTAETLVAVSDAPAASEFVDNLATLSVDESSATGSASYDLATDSFSLQDENGQISGTADTHRYYYLRAQGDVSIQAQIASLDAASDGSVAGLMIRSALYGKAPQASLLVSGSSQLSARTREAKGAGTTERQLSGTVATNPWLRIEKVGSSLRYYSKDTAGASWTLVGEDTIDLGNEVFLGFALAGGATEGLASVSFTRAQLDGNILILGDGAVKPSIPSGLLISSLTR